MSLNYGFGHVNHPENSLKHSSYTNTPSSDSMCSNCSSILEKHSICRRKQKDLDELQHVLAHKKDVSHWGRLPRKEWSAVMHAWDNAASHQRGTNK